MLSPVRPSVSSSDECITEKRFEVRIVKFAPYGSAIPLVFAGVSFIQKFYGFPRAGAWNKGGVGKTSHFLALNVNILKTVLDTTKVTIND